MKPTVIINDKLVNLEIPLTLAEWEEFKKYVPSYAEPEEYAELLIKYGDTKKEQISIKEEDIVTLKKDIILAYIDKEKFVADWIIKETNKLVDYILIKVGI